MTEAGVLEIDTSGEGARMGGGGGGRVHRVELVRAITSVEYHPYTGVLHRKANIVKFNSNRVLTSKATNRDKVGNKVRRDENIRHVNRSRGGRKRHMTDMCNG